MFIREKSVSKAAERSFLGQPAMSGALARLREFFQDEILVRTGRGMEPTAKALTLYAQLTPALESIRTTLFEQHLSSRFSIPRPNRGPFIWACATGWRCG
jgi:LysR family transcriptional activator of mexEF-oprN operon